MTLHFQLIQKKTFSIDLLFVSPNKNKKAFIIYDLFQAQNT